MKKKILHLITGLEIGGAEMMLLKTIPLLQNYFENEVCCIKGHGPIGEKLKQKGIPVTYLDLKVYNLPEISFVFWKIIREYKPDILVTYLIHADLFGRIIGKMCGVKHIICNQRGFYLNWKFLRIIDRLTKSLVSGYFVQTEYAREELMRILKLPKEKFVVVPNTVNIQDFRFSLNCEKKKNELKIPNENLNIICVSNLKPRKGFEELFEAFEMTYRNSRNISLLIVGDGNQKEKYIEQIKTYSSKNNIFFLGKRNDVKEILRISDVFVLGTYSEGMSNALLEAMVSKLAIITTNIEVNKELIENGVSGFLVPIQDPRAIADKMKLLIKNKDVRITLGERAYQNIVEKYEIGKIILLIKNTYKKIIYGT